MIETIQHFESLGLVSTDELATAEASQITGLSGHSIGYELELLPTAGGETPQVVKAREEGSHPVNQVWDELSTTGYEVGGDGVYELMSPAAAHPLPLVIATRGLVKAGWLPENPKGVVTAHVSIGTDKEIKNSSELHYRFMTLLRAVDLAGGTTPGRLMAPVTKGIEGSDEQPTTHYSWNRKGVAGVKVSHQDFEPLKRIEFRTPRYKSTHQFAETLDNIYFLSHAILSDLNSEAGRIYNNFEDWFINYRRAMGLPDENFDFDVMHLDRPIKEHAQYLKPYAKYLGRSITRHAGSNVVKIRVRQAVARLKEVFDATPQDHDPIKVMSRE